LKQFPEAKDSLRKALKLDASDAYYAEFPGDAVSIWKRTSMRRSSTGTFPKNPLSTRFEAALSLDLRQTFSDRAFAVPPGQPTTAERF
jgi:hypothetical protein